MISQWVQTEMHNYVNVERAAYVFLYEEVKTEGRSSEGKDFVVYIVIHGQDIRVRSFASKPEAYAFMAEMVDRLYIRISDSDE